MIYPAYTLGLRPKEISLISLDDIAFEKKEIILPNRKNTVPLQLPLPEEALKKGVKAISIFLNDIKSLNNKKALKNYAKAYFSNDISQ